MDTCKDCFFYEKLPTFEVGEGSGLCYSVPPTPSAIIYNGFVKISMNRPIVKGSDRLCVNNILMDSNFISSVQIGENNDSKQ